MLKSSALLAILDFKVVLTRPLICANMMPCGMVHGQYLVRWALSNLLVRLGEVPRKRDWVQRGKSMHLYIQLPVRECLMCLEAFFPQIPGANEAEKSATSVTSHCVAICRIFDRERSSLRRSALPIRASN